MQSCSDDGICRAEYSCVFPANIDMDGEWQANVPIDERIARIIDLDPAHARGKICVALSAEPPPESVRNASETPALIPDGGVVEGL